MEKILAAFAAEPVETILVCVLVLGLMSLPYILPKIGNHLQAGALRRARLNFDLPVIETLPEASDVLAIEDRVAGFLDADDWAGLGHYVSALAAKPETTSGGLQTYDVAVFAALQPVNDAEGYSGLMASLDPFRDAMRRLPQVPGLTGLCLRALQQAAWRAMGTFEGREPDLEGSRLFHRWLGEIEGIIAETGRSPAQSILLAEPLYHAAFAADEPSLLLEQRFEMIRAADSRNARIWSDRAHGLLPGWHGSKALLGRHLDDMVKALGESAVPLFTISILPCVVPEAVPGWTQKRFMDAVGEEGEDQVTVNVLAAMLHATGSGDLAHAVMGAYLNEIQAAVWRCEEDWLLAFDAAFGRKPSGRAGAGLPAAARIAAE